VARVQLVAPDTRDIHYIARNLRQPDVRELQAVHGQDVVLQDCLRAAVLASEICHVAVSASGEPVAVLGLAPVSLLDGRASPWLLGTDAMERYPRDIVVLGRQAVKRWGARYDQLFNYVDARNLKSIAWLKHIGFQVFDPQPYGLQGEPFHRFERCT
jgi:hypothetical protein